MRPVDVLRMSTSGHFCHAIERQEHLHDARTLAGGADVTMPADEPTLGEVARTLGRFADDTRTRFAELNSTISLMVTRDLYEAHRAAMQDDIKDLQAELKAERERKSADRRMVVSSMVAAGLSLIVTIVAAALLLALGLKP